MNVIRLISFTICLFLISSIGYAQDETAHRQSIEAHRLEIHKEFSDSSHSPLPKDEIAHFEGLDFFEINYDLLVKAKFVVDKGKKFEMKTSTDRLPVYRKYGELHFEIDGQAMVLEAYQNMALKKEKEYKDYLFIPFTDKTNGFESYGGGRYLDFRIPKGEEAVLDFNLAYNPYCAYSDRYSCPIPPEANRLPIRIEAGVKSYGHH